MSIRPDRGGVHRRAIAELVASILGAKENGFWAAHERLCRAEGVAPFRSRFLPDAYRFNTETQEIELYEVEVHCALTPAKIALLAEFWEDWDEEGGTDWLPVLILVDRFGNRSRMDLRCAVYGAGWASESARISPEFHRSDDPSRTTFLSRWLA